jgi:hypothetical protein
MSRIIIVLASSLTSSRPFAGRPRPSPADSASAAEP